MQNGAKQLGGAVGVHTAVVNFAFRPDNFRSADRALLRSFNFNVSARMIFVDLDDLGDHIATTLDPHPVADLEAETLDFVHVVQSRVANSRSADWNRLQFRD